MDRNLRERRVGDFTGRRFKELAAQKKAAEEAAKARQAELVNVPEQPKLRTLQPRPIGMQTINFEDARSKPGDYKEAETVPRDEDRPYGAGLFGEGKFGGEDD